MISNLAVETKQVTKQFGERTVINNLSIELPKGSIYGLLGPNGSGKSTTMKMLLGLTQPTAGSIYIGGQKLTMEARGRIIREIGALIEEPPGYHQLTGRENLRVVQKLLKLSDEDVDWALDMVGLTESQHRRVGHYSLGMKQRLGIALAIVRRPALLILDEPINGLDPAGIEEMRALITNLAADGATIMISSHILAEIEKVSTHIGILKGGEMIFQGARSELRDTFAYSLEIRTGEPQRAVALLPGAEPIPGGIRLREVLDGDINGLCDTLIKQSVPILEVVRPQQSLEEIFMSMTSDR